MRKITKPIEDRSTGAFLLTVVLPVAIGLIIAFGVIVYTFAWFVTTFLMHDTSIR